MAGSQDDLHEHEHGSAPRVAEPRFAGSLDVAETAFGLLTSGPDPLALECTGLGPGIPAGEVPLDRLRELLTGAPYEVRNRVWPELVIAAQQGGPAWLVGVVGVALPGLRRVAATVAAGSGELREDLDSEVLAAFCTALIRADPDGGRLPAKLYSYAEWAGRRRRTRDSACTRRLGRELPASSEPRPPGGHPDLVLAAAVRDEVVSPLQAELIYQTRLEKRHLRVVAADLGLSFEQVRHLRRTGERRLVASLTTEPSTERSPEETCRSSSHSGRSALYRTGEGASRTGRRGVCRDCGRRAWPTPHQPERRADPNPATAVPEPVMPPHPTATDEAGDEAAGAATSGTKGHLP